MIMMSPRKLVTLILFILHFIVFRIDAQPTDNTPPLITGQKQINIIQNTPLLILLSHLIVKDPDNKYPIGFSLAVLPGDNYSVKGSTVTPLPNFTTGTLLVNVKVNDGFDDSPIFKLQMRVIPRSSTPIIHGQKELAIPEDSSMTILLTHLDVSDEDDADYPNGFSLTVVDTSDQYTVTGNTITPALNLDGFIDVGIQVSDGKNASEPFTLSILVTPVNDPPEIASLDTTMLVYEPGQGPIDIIKSIEIKDIDSDHLSMVEVGFRDTNYSPANDELFTTANSANIKAVFDPIGILFLVGYATFDEYKEVIQSVQYNYRMTYDGAGNPSEIVSGSRTVYINLRDGPLVSQTLERQITMETKIALDIPNAFTPNGDLSNDTWRIRTVNKDQLDDAVVRVYNKRGQLLFESIGFDKEWDGISNGRTLPVDTYYYTIDLKLSYEKQTYKGSVTLLH
jgi:gliding motility-associated-like protein